MWRTTLRLAVFAAAVGAGLLVWATPAVADEADVRISASKTFRAGGSPGAVVIRLERDERECVPVRWIVGIGAAGLEPSMVTVERSVDGAWIPVNVAGGGGTVGFAGESRALCRQREVNARYRVRFSDDTPPGDVVFAVEARINGETVDSDSDRAEVLASRNPPSPSASPTPAATPVASATEGAGGPTGPVGGVVGGTGDGGGLGIGTYVMLVGVVMVGAGVALLWVIIRRMREGAPEPYYGDPALVAGAPTEILPTVPSYHPPAYSSGPDPPAYPPRPDPPTVPLPRDPGAHRRG